MNDVPYMMKRIRCRDDEGIDYTVIEHQEWIPAPTREDHSATLPGPTTYRLADGRSVTRVGGSTYRIDKTKTVIRRALSQGDQ